MHLLLPLKVLSIRSIRSKRTSRFPRGSSPDHALHLFQDHDGDLLRVQLADPESSGRADMAGR